MQYLTAVCDGALGFKRLGLATHRSRRHIVD